MSLWEWYVLSCFPYYIPADAFIKIIVAGIATYGVIAFMQFSKVKKIPLDVALKNVE